MCAEPRRELAPAPSHSAPTPAAPTKMGGPGPRVIPSLTLLAYASRVTTLEPGDLFVTVTPEGVGPLVSGDTLEIEITSSHGQTLGVLRERVTAP
jgi:hypothetical protein